MLLTGLRLRVAIVGLSIDQLVAWGVLYYAYTVLSAPIAVDLGVSRLTVAAAFSGCLLVAGWTARHVGPILDARGTAVAMRAGAIAAPVVFVALAAVADVAGLIVAFAALGVVHALTLYEPAFRTVVDWCPDERARSRAMLFLTSVGGFASTVFLPLSGWLVTHLGWRTAVVVLAAAVAVALLPVRFLLPLPRRKRARAQAPRAARVRSETLLAVGLAMQSLAATGVFVYLMWFVVEQGSPLSRAATIAGLAGAAQVPGRLASAPLRRAIGGAVFLPMLLGLQAAALLGAVVSGGLVATGCVLVFGAASGMMTLERATVLVEWYGRASFGARQGRLGAATNTARALSPFLVEAGHRVVSYASIFGALAAVLALAALMCAAAGRAHRCDAGSPTEPRRGCAGARRRPTSTNAAIAPMITAASKMSR